MSSTSRKITSTLPAMVSITMGRVLSTTGLRQARNSTTASVRTKRSARRSSSSRGLGSRREKVTKPGRTQQPA